MENFKTASSQSVKESLQAYRNAQDKFRKARYELHDLRIDLVLALPEEIQLMDVEQLRAIYIALPQLIKQKQLNNR